MARSIAICVAIICAICFTAHAQDVSVQTATNVPAQCGVTRTAFNLVTGVCCSGSVFTPPTPPGAPGGGSIYGGACCAGQGYNLNTQICCSGVINTIPGGAIGAANICCGKRAYVNVPGLRCCSSWNQ